MQLMKRSRSVMASGVLVTNLALGTSAWAMEEVQDPSPQGAGAVPSTQGTASVPRPV